MIIECENCRTKFNLDESLLKKGGSKVRCSLCKHAFRAYPPESPPPEEGEPELVYDEFEETVALDSPPTLAQEEPEAPEAGEETDFDKVFEESLEDEETMKAISSEGPDELEKEESVFPDEPLDEAAEEEPYREEVEDRPEEEFEDVEGLEPPAPPKRAKKSHALLIFLVVILILVGGSFAVIYWAPELLPDSLSILKPVEKKPPVDPGVRRLAFKAVTGSFVDSKAAGNLFVIRGTVTNNYPGSRSFIQVKGSILDDKGEVVRAKVAYAGNVFTDDEIKQRALDEIDKAMKNRFGSARQNFNVATEASIPFMIVFENLPENLSEFTVEAVSSSPGT
jgi:predicted Zn finger-like uncharacterized protein